MSDNILVFNTKKNKYIFDNVSGNVIPYNEMDEFIIRNYFEFDKEKLINELKERFNKEEEKIIASYSYISDLINLGYFYNASLIEGLDLETSLKKMPMAQLILILTEDCNLRCKYCVFSEQYPNIKTYSNKVMDFETAKLAIDEYISLYNDKVKYGYRKKPIISFYGGEPFLNFNVMKRVIDYCNDCNYDVKYYATTNGTIMTDEIIDYITNNDFSITFSIDGHKEQHDRNRVFSNDVESFDKVYENISKLQQYKKAKGIMQSISISCTYDDYSDFKKITDFFIDNYDMLFPFYIIFNKVSEFDTNYYSFCDEMHEKNLIKESKQESVDSYRELFEHFKNDSLNYKEVKILKFLFSSLNIINNRPKGAMGLWGGVCLPSNKIAVAPDGNYYVCERVNQKFKIGDIYSGLNLERCSDLFNKYLNIINENCKGCNISRLCEKCYMHFIQDESTLKFNSTFCNNRKKTMPRVLGNLYEVLEVNPNILKNDLASNDEKFFELLQVIK